MCNYLSTENITLLCAILFALLIIIVCIPSGHIFGCDDGDCEIYKWFIFSFIVTSSVGDKYDFDQKFIDSLKLHREKDKIV